MPSNPEKSLLGPGYSYQGLEWFDCELPTVAEAWPDSCEAIPGADIERYTRERRWAWGGRRIYFFSDIHADTDAFFVSLVASGGIAKTGPNDADFELTEQGRSALFIIGGDCFDKGPLNLRLLEAISQLHARGADIELLAGNHDVRTYLGIFYAESKAPRLDHLFIRMGKKTVPLLKEIHDKFVAADEGMAAIDNDAAIAETLFPAEGWYEEFPQVVADEILEERIDKEVRRIREKSVEFIQCAEESGLSIAQVYQAVMKFRELFVDPGGRYAWFFDKMKLVHQEGSFLFVHAGIDDAVADLIRDRGIDFLNAEFRRMLRTNPFELYHGQLGNMIRTKYRAIDYPLTESGVRSMHASGIFAIVHGHRKLRQGQQLVVRSNILNLECDASVDCNTRASDALDGPGGAAVVFEEAGRILAISTDYPFIKTFDPHAHQLLPESF